jgi:hypothetical protein
MAKNMGPSCGQDLENAFLFLKAQREHKVCQLELACQIEAN